MNNKQILQKALSLPNGSNKYAFIVDFTRKANEHRFFLINLEKEKIEYSWPTSHGSGGGPLERCVEVSNVPNSRMSSSGLVRCAETYNSKKFGYALRLDGLEDINSNIRKRSIVIHPSVYISIDYLKTHNYPGRSWGCITLEPDYSFNVIEKLKNGSYGFIFGP